MSAEILTREDLQPVLDSQKHIEEMLALIVESLAVREVYTLEDICRKLHISKDQARTRPYLLPNYGVPDYPGRIRKWNVSTYRAWVSIPPLQHQRNWNLKSPEERQLIANASRGAVAGNIKLRQVI